MKKLLYTLALGLGLLLSTVSCSKDAMLEIPTTPQPTNLKTQVHIQYKYAECLVYIDDQVMSVGNVKEHGVKTIMLEYTPKTVHVLVTVKNYYEKDPKITASIGSYEYMTKFNLGEINYMAKIWPLEIKK